MKKLTRNQLHVLAVVIRNTRSPDQWYRAASSGERVTLASLFYQSLLVRRAWRVGSGEREYVDSAHEYRPAGIVEQAITEMRDV